MFCLDVLYSKLLITGVGVVTATFEVKLLEVIVLNSKELSKTALMGVAFPAFRCTTGTFDCPCNTLTEAPQDSRSQHGEDMCGCKRFLPGVAAPRSSLQSVLQCSSWSSIARPVMSSIARPFLDLNNDAVT